MVWQAPPHGWLNGSAVCSSARRGVGFVVRDHDGKLLLRASVPLQNVSVPMAEMIASWNAITAAVFRWELRNCGLKVILLG